MGLYKRNFVLYLFIFVLINIPISCACAVDKIPRIRAILYGKSNPQALLYYQNKRFYVREKMNVDQEWIVDEIRRENILFKHKPTGKYIKAELNAPKKARFHKNWSFYGKSMALWETIELLANGFGYNALMHFQAGAAVVPGCHGKNMVDFLLRLLPSHHRFVITGPLISVLPVNPAGEEWTNVLRRMRKCNPERLRIRYPGLTKAGILLSRGDDIQFVLRKIALGSNTPISFPRDMHFPVYALFKRVPFSQILAKTVYLNQCIIIEREDGLEVSPWPRQILRRRPFPDFPMVQASPHEPQEGWGPKPPLEIKTRLYEHPVIHQDGKLIASTTSLNYIPEGY